MLILTHPNLNRGIMNIDLSTMDIFTILAVILWIVSICLAYKDDLLVTYKKCTLMGLVKIIRLSIVVNAESDI